MQWSRAVVAEWLPGLPPARFRSLLLRVLFLEPAHSAYFTRARSRQPVHKNRLCVKSFLGSRAAEATCTHKLRGLVLLAGLRVSWRAGTRAVALCHGQNRVCL